MPLNSMDRNEGVSMCELKLMGNLPIWLSEGNKSPNCWIWGPKLDLPQPNCQIGDFLTQKFPNWQNYGSKLAKNPYCTFFAFFALNFLQRIFCKIFAKKNSLRKKIPCIVQGITQDNKYFTYLPIHVWLDTTILHVC